MKATELLALFCENVREMQEPDCETLRGVLHLRQKSILPLEILKLLKIAMPEGKEVQLQSSKTSARAERKPSAAMRDGLQLGNNLNTLQRGPRLYYN